MPLVPIGVSVSVSVGMTVVFLSICQSEFLFLYQSCSVCRLNYCIQNLRMDVFLNSTKLIKINAIVQTIRLMKYPKRKMASILYLKLQFPA